MDGYMEYMPSYCSSSNDPESFNEGDVTYLPLPRTPSREEGWVLETRWCSRNRPGI